MTLVTPCFGRFVFRPAGGKAASASSFPRRPTPSPFVDLGGGSNRGAPRPQLAAQPQVARPAASPLAAAAPSAAVRLGSNERRALLTPLQVNTKRYMALNMALNMFVLNINEPFYHAWYFRTGLRDPDLIGSIFFWAKSGFIKIQNHSDLNPDAGSYLVFFTIEIEIDKKIEKSKTKNVFCLVINIWLDTIGYKKYKNYMIRIHKNEKSCLDPCKMTWIFTPVWWRTYYEKILRPNMKSLWQGKRYPAIPVLIWFPDDSELQYV